MQARRAVQKVQVSTVAPSDDANVFHDEDQYQEHQSFFSVQAIQLPALHRNHNNRKMITDLIEINILPPLFQRTLSYADDKKHNVQDVRIQAGNHSSAVEKATLSGAKAGWQKIFPPAPYCL